MLQQTAQGDMGAYRTLVDRYLVWGVRVAERMLGNRQDAEDVMQETCLKIWDEAGRWTPRAKFTTWLYRVLLNACIDRKRRFVPEKADLCENLIDGAPIAEDILVDRQRSDAVRDALQRLPDRQRAAVVLNYYEEKSNRDAAELMDIETGAYQQLLFRARQNLRNFLMEGRDEVRTGS
ncbi:MAG: sigma-70 family RNA polymerase sigma factor [Alphaproteobacteria bacterium]|nr:sigma-70 family RNA polymerase sigma factor [Alphaproteobacteria bacterium]